MTPGKDHGSAPHRAMGTSMPLACAQCRWYAYRTGQLHAPPEACPLPCPFPALESLHQTAPPRRGYPNSASGEHSHNVSSVEFAGWEDVEVDRVARAFRDRCARAREIHFAGKEPVLARKPVAALDADEHEVDGRGEPPKKR